MARDGNTIIVELPGLGPVALALPLEYYLIRRNDGNFALLAKKQDRVSWAQVRFFDPDPVLQRYAAILIKRLIDGEITIEEFIGMPI